MNYKEIIQTLEDKIESVDEFAYDNFNSEDLGLGEIKEVHQQGGEGVGEDWRVVMHFVDHNVYIEVSGAYSSYNGTDFEDWDEACKEVKPETVEVVVYKPLSE